MKAPQIHPGGPSADRQEARSGGATRVMVRQLAALILLATPCDATIPADESGRSQPVASAAGIYHAQGGMAGEVTQTTAILQSRLSAAPGPTEGDVPGVHGWGKFQYALTPDFAQAGETDWIEAKQEADCILRQQIYGLQPGRTYHYRLIVGVDRSLTQTGPVHHFKTLPQTDQTTAVRFAVGNCMNYAFFFNGPKGDGRKARADAKDRELGYPAMESIRRLQPDFFIGAGDNVYYDHPAKTPAKTLAEMRRKWHEQFALPRVAALVGEVSTYWMKDDHDYRYNDSDPSGENAPSHALGVRTFREQMPVVPFIDSTNATYRTIRCGKLLQLWMVEGRDYRSPNSSPDGPEKTIWGAEQAAWLKRTLLASDAPFKILVSPTPMVGPDDAYKRDNHVSPNGFRREGEEFFAWLVTNQITGLYIITGDRHWHYHSIHPSGYEEFACGALNTENSRLGRNPGDPKSTDPQSLVRQLYSDAKPTGGYLLVEALPPQPDSPAHLSFSIRDEWGKELYSATKTTLALQPGGHR